MKKFAIYAFALLATATTLTSCGDDEETTVTPTKTEAVVSGTLTLGGQNNSEGSFLSTKNSSGAAAVYKTSASADFVTQGVNVSFAQGITVSGSSVPAFISLDARTDAGLSSVTNISTTTYFKKSSLDKAKFDTAAAYINTISIPVSSTNKIIKVEDKAVYEVVSGSSKALIYVSRLNDATGFNGQVDVVVRRVK